MSAHRPIALALCLIAALAGSRPAHAAFDAVLCLKNTGSGTPKFRIGKPPASAACKSTEIQIARFDGTTLQFTGINVQIVSGSGLTDNPVNGKGNLIVGYNEGSTGTGSHNLVVGKGHTYSSYGGFVAGHGNTVNAPFASVSGGECNVAGAGPAPSCLAIGGAGTSVSGGNHNVASATDAAVSGGAGNKASGGGASVSGGANNAASGLYSSISGGQNVN